MDGRPRGCDSHTLRWQLYWPIEWRKNPPRGIRNNCLDCLSCCDYCQCQQGWDWKALGIVALALNVASLVDPILGGVCQEVVYKIEIISQIVAKLSFRWSCWKLLYLCTFKAVLFIICKPEQPGNPSVALTTARELRIDLLAWFAQHHKYPVFVILVVKSFKSYTFQTSSKCNSLALVVSWMALEPFDMN